MKVVILGGTGFLGQSITEHCCKNNIDHVAVNRANYDQVKGTACDVLINANGNSKKFLADRDPVGEFDLSSTSVLRSIKDFSFKRYLLVSTIAVYADSKNPAKNSETAKIDITKQSHYGFHKYCAEQIVQHYCSDWLIVRLGGLIGPGMKKGPVFDILNGGQLWVERKSQFQFIDTREVARCLFILLKKKIAKNQIFNLCGQGTITLAEIERLAGKNCPSAEKTVKETWNINAGKMNRLIKLSRTEDTVRRFVKEALTR